MIFNPYIVLLEQMSVSSGVDVTTEDIVEVTEEEVEDELEELTGSISSLSLGKLVWTIPVHNC